MRANVEVKHTLRGHAARVGGALAGVVLAWAIQPFATETHRIADKHLAAYTSLLHQAGIYYDIDINGPQPGDQQLIDEAHAEWNTAGDWQYATLAIEGGALMLVTAGVAVGQIAGRRSEQADAVWRAATEEPTASE